MNKITGNDIYDEFRKKFPKRSKAAVRYAPYGYMSIMVYFRMVRKWFTIQWRVEEG